MLEDVSEKKAHDIFKPKCRWLLRGLALFGRCVGGRDDEAGAFQPAAFATTSFPVRLR